MTHDQMIKLYPPYCIPQYLPKFPIYPVQPLAPGNDEEPSNSILARLHKQITDETLETETRLTCAKEGLDKIEVLRIIAGMGASDLKENPALKNSPPALLDYISDPGLAQAHLDKLIPHVFKDRLATENPRTFWHTRLDSNGDILNMYSTLTELGIEIAGKLYGKDPDAILSFKPFYAEKDGQRFRESKEYENTIMVRTAQLIIASGKVQLNNTQLGFLTDFVKAHENAPEIAGKLLSCFHENSDIYCSPKWSYRLNCPYEGLWRDAKATLENQLENEEFEQAVKKEKARRTDAETRYISYSRNDNIARHYIFQLCVKQHERALKLKDPVHAGLWKSRAEDLAKTIPEKDCPQDLLNDLILYRDKQAKGPQLCSLFNRSTREAERFGVDSNEYISHVIKKTWPPSP